jgi:hypothetical protein
MELFVDQCTAMAEAAKGMNDYQLIWDNETHRRLTPKETVHRHKQSAKKTHGIFRDWRSTEIGGGHA